MNRLPVAIAMGLLCGSTLYAACASDPLTLKLPPMRFSGEPAIKVLISVAQKMRICFGVEGVIELYPKVSVDTANLTFRDLLVKIAPRMRIHLDHGVVSLERHATDSWLDTPLTLDITKRDDVNNVNAQVGTALYFAALPKGGILGSIGQSGVLIGPYPKQTHTARAWLNLLVHDVGGGFWVTLKTLAKREGAPSAQPWGFFMFRDSIKFNQDQVIGPESRLPF